MCNKLAQLKFKLEKNIGIYKSAGKVRKDVFLKKVVRLIPVKLLIQNII